MIILIQSSGDPRSEFEVDQELQRAFSALHSARIRALGGGRFMDGSGYVVLAHDADGTAALAALKGAGVRASELKPHVDPNARRPSGPLLHHR
ncbi:MAG TPA: hypothetical protein VEF07_05075 [Candidatus Binataceae bacterium]|nr:hypothetical protein [Candidatus Binataceae bacterium]